MEYCLAAAALNGVDRRSLQRSARLGREVLERAKRRAVDWHSPEGSRGSVGVLYRQSSYQERWSVTGPRRLLGEVRARAGGGGLPRHSWPPAGPEGTSRGQKVQSIRTEWKNPLENAFDTFYDFTRVSSTQASLNPAHASSTSFKGIVH